MLAGFITEVIGKVLLLKHHKVNKYVPGPQEEVLSSTTAKTPRWQRDDHVLLKVRRRLSNDQDEQGQKPGDGDLVTWGGKK